MEKLVQLQKNLKKVRNKEYLILATFEQIKRYENVFVNLQKKQLSKGEDNEGSLFGTYSFATQEIAASENPRKPKIAGKPYNFEYTGGLFDGMQLIVNEDNAEFWSKDSKTPDLVLKYDGLFGLQEKELRQVLEKLIIPALLLELRSVLNI